MMQDKHKSLLNITSQTLGRALIDKCNQTDFKMPHNFAVRPNSHRQRINNILSDDCRRNNNNVSFLPKNQSFVTQNFYQDKCKVKHEDRSFPSLYHELQN